MLVREDIPSGYQAVMGVHAGIQFAVDYHLKTEQWESSSNSLVILSARDELELIFLFKELDDQDIAVTGFHEPDFNNELMSVATILNKQQAKILSSKPLLLKDK